MRVVGASAIADVLDRVSRDGLQRLVTRLAGDLDAHDRAAELAVVNGTWDWLADEDDAAAVHPWLEAAVIGQLPREQRADALKSVKPQDQDLADRHRSTHPPARQPAGRGMAAAPGPRRPAGCRRP